jgi:HEAT repeat protein
MRGLTGAVVAAAVVLIVVIALMVQSDRPEPEKAPAKVAAGNADRGGSRSARVEDRLSRLRDDFERRQLGGALKQPQAKPRELPTASERDMRMAEDDEDKVADPEELEELKATLFKNADPDERIGAVLMLTGDEGPESLRVLLEAMQDPNPEVRLAVVEAIGDRAEDIEPVTLTPALRDPDAEVRFEAVSILGDMESPDAMAMVREALDDPDEDVRALTHAACPTRRGLRSPSYVPPLRPRPAPSRAFFC